jgi:hypothetical protein
MEYILFWSEYDNKMSYNEFINKNINLSILHKLVLKAHKKLNNKVILFTYQKIVTHLPKNVTIKNANQYIPTNIAYEILKSGHSIAHISDAIRLKYASQVNGVVIDFDAIVLKKLPEQSGWFASMPAKKSGGVAPKWGKSHPPLTIHDKSWDGKELAAFPVKVNKSMSKYIENLSHIIMHKLLKPKKTNWNFVIWNIKEIMKKDKNYKVYEPIYFCPIPAWLGKNKCYSIQKPTKFNNKTELFGYKLPSIEKILNESFVVQHFFESTFTKSEKKEKDFWINLPDETLLAKEAEFILGKNWKHILLNE